MYAFFVLLFLHFFIIFSKYKHMELYYIFLIIFLCLIILLFFPLFFQVRFYINAIKNFGVISINFLFFIPIICFCFKVKPKSITILKKKKQKDILINFNNYKTIILFYNFIFKKLMIFKSFVFGEIGIKNDAFKSAMLSGFSVVVFDSFLSFLHNNKKSNAQYVCKTNFDENQLKFSGYMSFLIFPIYIYVFLIKLIFQRIKKGAKNGAK